MSGDVYFLTVEEVVAIHTDQIDRYGGDRGLRDRGLLDSAVQAAQNVAAYVEDCVLCDLAAAYLFLRSDQARWMYDSPMATHPLIVSDSKGPWKRVV